MSDIRLIVGLGNPGPAYAHTRHNAGTWFLDELARCFNISLSSESKFFGRTGRIAINNKDVRLLAPSTFMNKSGQAVAAMANFYRIPTEQIMVAFDELDLEPGTIKYKVGGSSSQNGVRDIVSSLANNRDFLRLRIGIGHPGHKSRVTGHVLGKPSAVEKQFIEEAIDEAVRCMPILLDDGLKVAQNRLHAHKPSA